MPQRISLLRKGSQWQNGQKPTKETILNDIERKESYVLIVEDQIAGTAALVRRGSRLHKNRW